MRVAIDPGDRKLLIVSGALFVAVSITGLVVSRPQVGGPAGFPSSYSSASDGAKAAFLLLEELGCRIEHWTLPPSDLPKDPQGTLLVLADSFVPPSAEEKADLRTFVSRGGQALVTGAGGAGLLSETGVQPTAEPEFTEKMFAAELPAPLTRNAPEIFMRSSVRWERLRPSEQRYYGDDEGATVVSYRLGKGKVVWWGGSTPLTNHGLTQASNLALYLNSLGLNTSTPSQTHVLWDEYFHGDRVSFWAYLGRTPAPWAVLQLGLLAAAALFTYGRRSGPVRAPVHESRLSPLEFIETLGGLYQRKGAAREALEIVYHRFRLRLVSRMALPAAASTDQIARGVRERLGWTVPGFWEILQLCERGIKSASLREAEAMRLIQELHDYSRRFRLQSTGSGPV
jgi:hypothetical protein